MTTRKTKLNGLEFLNNQGRITLNDKSKVRLYSNENKSKYYISKKYSNDSGNYGYPNSKLIAEVTKDTIMDFCDGLISLKESFDLANKWYYINLDEDTIEVFDNLKDASTGEMHKWYPDEGYCAILSEQMPIINYICCPHYSEISNSWYGEIRIISTESTDLVNNKIEISGKSLRELKEVFLNKIKSYGNNID